MMYYVMIHNYLLEMDQNWITQATSFIGLYLKVVNNFMKFAHEHTKEGEAILCPCNKCQNIYVYDQKEVKCHINVNGMAMTYTR
jgi:hypothetical protein